MHYDELVCLPAILQNKNNYMKAKSKTKISIQIKFKKEKITIKTNKYKKFIEIKT